MPDDHPSRGLLERFMRNQVDAPERRRVVRHLLAGCSRCSAVTRRLWSYGEERLEDASAGGPHPDGGGTARVDWLLAEELSRVRHREGKLAAARGAAGLSVEAAIALLDLAVLAALLYFRRLVETEHARLDSLSVVSHFVTGTPRPRRGPW